MTKGKNCGDRLSKNFKLENFFSLHKFFLIEAKNKFFYSKSLALYINVRYIIKKVCREQSSVYVGGEFVPDIMRLSAKQ